MILSGLGQVPGLSSQVAALAKAYQVIIAVVRRIVVNMVRRHDDIIGPIGPATVLTGTVGLPDN